MAIHSLIKYIDHDAVLLRKGSWCNRKKQKST